MAACVLMGFTACNDYLDKLPDDRAQVDTQEKVQKLLTSAYPTHMPNLLFEMSSDNVTDNGSQYAATPAQDEIYRFKDDPNTDNDDPYSLWNGFYYRVGTCDSADVYLGLPYPTEPEQSVDTKYKRGTLKELYANINRDIEAALPRISDSYMTTPKYHFNKSAAYAFAARFNLMIHNYDKAIEYATTVLGSNPDNRLRDYTPFASMSPNDIQNAYVKSSENANLLIITAYSSASRALTWSSSFRRYGHNRNIDVNETFYAKAPWGSGSNNNTLVYAHKIFQYNAAQQYFPKVQEFFETTDKVNNTGYAHIVFPAFSTEETLLVRAEAYAMKKDYAHALDDMNAWIRSHCIPSNGTARRPTLTEESINTFMDGVRYSEVIPTANSQRTIKKNLHPQGFTIETGTQENLIQMILHMRRLETWGEGLRFVDIKRYGIEYAHLLDGEDPVVFRAADKRGAIQLPEDVINAGLEANPR